MEVPDFSIKNNCKQNQMSPPQIPSQKMTTEQAHTILQQTNPVTTELDIYTPLKSANFALTALNNETNELIYNDSSDSIPTQLLEHSSTAKQKYQSLQSSLDPLNSILNRLKSDLVQPVGQLSELLNILANTQSFGSLVRELTYFIVLISRIQQLEDSDSQDIVELSQLYAQLNRHLLSNRQLLALKIVRDYDTTKSLRVSKLEDKLSAQVANALDTDDFVKVASAFSALNRDKLQGVYNQWAQTQIQSIISLLKRLLTSSKASIPKITAEIKTVALKTEEQIKQWKSLAMEVQEMSLLWKEIKQQFNPLLQNTINQGGPVHRALKSHKQILLEQLEVNNIPMKQLFESL